MSEKKKETAETTVDDWRRLAARELGGRAPDTLVRQSPEGLTLKPLYGPADVAGDAARALPGFAPYRRGVRATMYANRPWTIRQYAGFSTAAESNAFFHQALAEGQTGLSVAFDLATHRGYDSDHPRVAGDVGKAGVAIDTVGDMERLFEGIPLDGISVSMTMNGAVIPVMAFFIVAAERQGVAAADLAGTIQNDILKEFLVRNTYIYPPAPSMRLTADVIDYCARQMPKFNSVSISGYHMQEAGATILQELAFTLADGKEYVKTAMARGLDIDGFAGRLSFFFNIGMNFFMEIAKLRAARILWAEIMGELGAKNPRSLMLRTHCQTSGVSLTEQDPYNNIVRTAFEALAAALGGTQSLHTNSFDEAIALPGDEAARIARNTQIILAGETGITGTVDPLGGSYYVESLTDELVAGARGLIGEIDALGGMAKALDSGLPKRMIGEAATRRQARIERGDDLILGVNRNNGGPGSDIAVRRIETRAVRERQLGRLKAVRKGRDEAACRAALADLEAVARGDGNVLEAAIPAARAEATLGEISTALEAAFGRYQATAEAIPGVYAALRGADADFGAAREKVATARQDSPRDLRILIAKLGQDGHDRGGRVIASAFADLGFEVSLGPLFQTPEEVADAAIAADVAVLGISSLAGSHLSLIPEVIEALGKAGRSDIRVIAGGVIPAQDHAELKAAGVAAIFGPGTSVIGAAEEVLDLVLLRRND